MAMESACPSAKKLKLAPPNIHEAAPSRSPSESTDPKPAIPEIRSQEQPPEAGEDGGEDSPDRISDLPDVVLGEIISLLLTKDGARTQALASRWRNIWRDAPINLDCRGLPDALFGARGFEGISGDNPHRDWVKPLHSPNPLKTFGYNPPLRMWMLMLETSVWSRVEVILVRLGEGISAKALVVMHPAIHAAYH